MKTCVLIKKNIKLSDDCDTLLMVTMKHTYNLQQGGDAIWCYKKIVIVGSNKLIDEM